MSFESLGLSQKILQAIAEAGYQHPTPIQEQVIPFILNGLDVFGIAQTGTGKTASYCLPLLDLLERSRLRARLPRAMILAPTRELALQIRDALEVYGRYYQLKTAVVIGGESALEQERALNKGVDIVIATPGRLLDTLNRGKVMLSAIQFLVIDEADRMLDMGFIPDIEKILTFMVNKHQSLLFSATASEPIRQLIKNFLNNPIEVFITPASQTAETIDQFQIRVTAKQKREVLRHLITAENVQNALIFCNRKKDVSTLCSSLKRHGFKAGMIHGDLSQRARTETLERFKQGEIHFLVASDIAARGLDIDELSFVFNFDVPTNAEEYVHRIGRTGRAGRSGKAFTLVAEDDLASISSIEKLIAKEIPLMMLEEKFKQPVQESAKTTCRSQKSTPNQKSTSKKSKKENKLAEHAREMITKPIPTEEAPIKPIDKATTGDQSVLANQKKSPKQSKSSSSSLNTAKAQVKGFGQEVPAFFYLSWPAIMSIDTMATKSPKA